MGFDIENVTVTPEGNLPVVTPTVLTKAGYVVDVDEIDSGSKTGTPLRRAAHTTQIRNRRSMGLDTILFDDAFNATAHNTGLYRFIFATLTATQSGGSILFNSGSTLTTTTGCQFTTWRHFNLRASGGLEVELVKAFTAAPLTNQVVEFGFFPHGTGTAAPTEGIFFRYTTAGLIGVVNYNTVETTTAAMWAPGDFTANKNYRFSIRIDQRGIEFYRDGILGATLPIPDANGFPFMWNALPLTCQFRNAGAVSGSVMQSKLAAWSVEQLDVQTVKPWAHQLAMMGLAYQGMNGGAMGSLANVTNSQAAGAGAAMTNTTAALGVGLGGQFSAQPTLAVPNDGILCSYQNPAGGINQTPRTLVITGVRLQGLVTTAFTGGPVYYAVTLAWGHTAVSAATAETGSFVTATAKAPRRRVLGYETYVVTAPVGTLGQGVYVKFDSPVVVNPGEFVAILLKNLGTVTSAGVITYLVDYDHYWE